MQGTLQLHAAVRSWLYVCTYQLIQDSSSHFFRSLASSTLASIYVSR